MQVLGKSVKWINRADSSTLSQEVQFPSKLRIFADLQLYGSTHVITARLLLSFITKTVKP